VYLFGERASTKTFFRGPPLLYFPVPFHLLMNFSFQLCLRRSAFFSCILFNLFPRPLPSPPLISFPPPTVHDFRTLLFLENSAFLLFPASQEDRLPSPSHGRWTNWLLLCGCIFPTPPGFFHHTPLAYSSFTPFPLGENYDSDAGHGDSGHLSKLFHSPPLEPLLLTPTPKEEPLGAFSPRLLPRWISFPMVVFPQYLFFFPLISFKFLHPSCCERSQEHVSIDAVDSPSQVP